MDTLTFQTVPVDVVRPLRQAILRPGKPPSAAIWDGDDASDTRHFAARAGADVVGIATLLHKPHAVADDPHAWQLRGMATASGWQGRGVGSALLGFLLDHCRDQDGGSIVWCNARITARDFYLRHGFEVIGGEFLIPEVGPHVVMRRHLRAAGDSA